MALWDSSFPIDAIDAPNIQLQHKLSCQDGIVPYNHCTLIKFVEDPCLYKCLFQLCLHEKVLASTYAYNAQLYAMLGLRIWVPHSTHFQIKNAPNGVNSHRQ